jgi:hypothetical protein
MDLVELDRVIVPLQVVVRLPLTGPMLSVGPTSAVPRMGAKFVPVESAAVQAVTAELDLDFAQLQVAVKIHLAITSAGPTSVDPLLAVKFVPVESAATRTVTVELVPVSVLMVVNPTLVSVLVQS